MKTRKASKIVLLSVLASGSVAPVWSANNFFPTNPTVNLATDPTNGLNPAGLASLSTTQNFLGFTGTGASLLTVPGFFLGREDVNPNFPQSTVRQGQDSAGGFYSLGLASSPTHYAVGMLEASGFKDFRVNLKFKNDLGHAVNRLLVTYDIEQWRNGERINQVSLRYAKELADIGDASDIVTTTAPVNSGTQLDGTLSANRVAGITALVPLPVALADTTEAYLRWGYTSPGSGSRDNLAVTNVTVQELASGLNNRSWSGATTNSWTAASKWDAGAYTWAGSTNNALFPGTGASPVDLQTTVNLVDLIFSNNFTISSSTGSPVLALSGVIDVASAKTAIIQVPVTGTYGIIKLGDGILELGTGASANSNVAVLDGTLKLTANNVIAATSSVRVNEATFDLNDKNVTVESLSAQDGAGNIVTFGSAAANTLTIQQNTTASASFRGVLSGGTSADTLIKTGTGKQRFRSSNKTYAAVTQVDDGVLELTDNVGLPNTADVKLNGVTSLTPSPDTHGTLLLSNESGADKTFTLGSSVTIDIKGGAIAAESSASADSITLANNIAFDTTDIGGVNPAHNNVESGGNAGGTVLTDLQLTGVLSGGGLRKTGKGDLTITNASNSHAYNEIRNGKLTLAPGARFGGATGVEGKLYIKDEANTRTFVFSDNLTVTWLEASAPAAPAANTGFLVIPNTKTLTVNQTAVLDTNDEDGDLDTTEELKPSYDIAMSGSGSFVKTGNGTQKFTNNAKTLTGSVTVAKGTLQVSKNGVISGTGVTVNSGGQLRLSTGVDDLADIADATYTFGNDIVLNSTQREVSGVITTSGFGHLGGLRFDPEDGIQYAVLTNNVNINSASDIHVNGLEKVLFLSGAITGSADLSRTGGGRVVVEGNSSYSGTLTLVNGATTIDLGSGDSLDAVDVIVETGAELGAESGNLGTITGNVTVNAGGRLSIGETVAGGVGTGNFLPVGPLNIGGDLAVAATSGSDVTVLAVSAGTVINVTGNADLPNDLVIDLNSTGTVNTTYDLVIPSGTATINGGSAPVTLSGSQVQNLPAGANQVTLSISSGKIRIRPIP